MKILSLCAGPVETNAYLIVDEESQCAVAVDTPMDSAGWFEEESRKHRVVITEIWLTHSHWDHTADCEAVRAATNAKVILHQADEYRLIDPNAHVVFSLPFQFAASKADRFVAHGDVLTLGAFRWEVRHVPGHTEGSVCFIHHESKIAIVGDTLFRGSIGRTDLPGGNHDLLIRSIRNELFSLPNEYVVLPGHMGNTTIGEERAEIPFVGDTSDVWDS